MSSRYFDTLFTPSVKATQEREGSRRAYSRYDGLGDAPDELTAIEAAFIGQRDSFYIATTSESGWPYIQHRGGPKGFIKVIDPRTLAFADHRGNRQYVSVGNLGADGRAALFFMDYPNRRRLKLLAHVEVAHVEDAPQLAALVVDPAYRAHPERIFVLRVEAFDWNCPQHITPRYTADELPPMEVRPAQR